MNTKDNSRSDLLSKVGVRPADSRWHDYCRTLVLIGLVCMIVWSIYTDHEETVELDDLSDFINKDSMMYMCISEMDHRTQQKYAKLLKQAFDDDDTLFWKYYKRLVLALSTAIFSEYIISGGTRKPLSNVARTVVSTAWTTSLAR